MILESLVLLYATLGFLVLILINRVDKGWSKDAGVFMSLVIWLIWPLPIILAIVTLTKENK